MWTKVLDRLSSIGKQLCAKIGPTYRRYSSHPDSKLWNWPKRRPLTTVVQVTCGKDLQCASFTISKVNFPCCEHPGKSFASVWNPAWFSLVSPNLWSWVPKVYCPTLTLILVGTLTQPTVCWYSWINIFITHVSVSV